MTAAILRRLLGLRSPSLDVAAGRVPAIDPARVFGADWRLSRAPATVRARRRRRMRAARRQSALAAPVTEALVTEGEHGVLLAQRVAEIQATTSALLRKVERVAAAREGQEGGA